jgi:hypothetical protein
MQVSVVCLLAFGKLCCHPVNMGTVMASCVPAIVQHLQVLGSVWLCHCGVCEAVCWRASCDDGNSGMSFVSFRLRA